MPIRDARWRFRVKKHLGLFVGSVFTFPSIWQGLIWMSKKAFELAEHIDFISSHLPSPREATQKIEELPELPQWIGVPLLLIGLLLIWLDSRRRSNTPKQNGVEEQQQVGNSSEQPTPSSLFDLFKSEFPSTLKADREFKARMHSGKEYTINRRSYLDFSAGAWFGGFYLPSGCTATTGTAPMLV